MSKMTFDIFSLAGLITWKRKKHSPPEQKGIWLKYSIAHIGFARVSLPTDRTQEIKKRLPWESILHPR